MRRDSKFNISWLVTFESAARTLSFTKTAEELGMSQGAVSIQIRKLEQTLGATLFERRGRHIVLTDEGHSYHPQVSEAVATLFDTTSRLFTGKRLSVVTLSCYSPAIADLWIAPRIAGLMAKIPELQVDITVDYQASGARGERDDLIFTLQSSAGPQFIPLVEEKLIAVCTPQYLAGRGADWGRGALIESTGSRGTWAAWRTAAGVQLALDGREVRVNSTSAALRLAECGVGAALVARDFVAGHLKKGTLVDLVPGKSLPGRVHGLSALNLASARPIVKQVAAHFLHEANRALPDYLGSASSNSPR